MGLYAGGLIIGRIFTSEILGPYFQEGLFWRAYYQNFTVPNIKNGLKVSTIEISKLFYITLQVSHFDVFDSCIAHNNCFEHSINTVSGCPTQNLEEIHLIIVNNHCFIIITSMTNININWYQSITINRLIFRNRLLLQLKYTYVQSNLYVMALHWYWKMDWYLKRISINKSTRLFHGLHS